MQVQLLCVGFLCVVFLNKPLLVLFGSNAGCIGSPCDYSFVYIDVGSSTSTSKTWDPQSQRAMGEEVETSLLSLPVFLLFFLQKLSKHSVTRNCSFPIACTPCHLCFLCLLCERATDTSSTTETASVKRRQREGSQFSNQLERETMSRSK